MSFDPNTEAETSEAFKTVKKHAKHANVIGERHWRQCTCMTCGSTPISRAMSWSWSETLWLRLRYDLKLHNAGFRVSIFGGGVERGGMVCTARHVLRSSCVMHCTRCWASANRQLNASNDVEFMKRFEVQ